MGNAFQNMGAGIQQVAVQRFGLDLAKADQKAEFGKQGALAGFISGTIIPALADKNDPMSPHQALFTTIQQGSKLGLSAEVSLGLFSALQEQLDKETGGNPMSALEQAQIENLQSQVTRRGVENVADEFKAEDTIRQTALEAQRQDPAHQEQMEFQKERGKTGAPVLNQALGNLKTAIDKAKTDPRYAKLENKTEALIDILGNKAGLGQLEGWFYRNKYEKMEQLVGHLTDQLMKTEEIGRFYNAADIKKKVEAIMKGEPVQLEGEAKAPALSENGMGLGGIAQVP
jgi:hypothetical protein